MDILQRIAEEAHQVNSSLEVMESTDDSGADVREFIIRSTGDWFVLLSYDTNEEEAHAQLFSDSHEEVQLVGDLDNWVLPNLVSVLERLQ